MGIDVFYIDPEKNKTTKINATPGAGGKWDFAAVCDDCSTVAYDHNVEASAMIEIGFMSEDHNCIYYLEPEDRARPGNRCACSCHPAIK